MMPMPADDGHYARMLREKGRTRFARCGYQDRFDPFVLGRDPAIQALYGSVFGAHLEGIPRGIVLDAGCGTGIYFEVLAAHAEELDAVDASEDMVRTAREYCERVGLSNVHPEVGSVESLPYEDGRFDVAVACDLLHHVENLDKALDEICRVLKPGGHFLVFEPNVCNPLMFLAHALPAEERRALRRNRPAALRALLETRFAPVRWQGVCALVTQTSGMKRLLLDTYLRLWRITGLERLYPRQVWLGVVKRAP